MSWVFNIFGFLLTAAYWPGSYGSATSPRWSLLAVGLPLLLLVTKPNASMTLGHKWGLLFLAWAAASLLWTANLYDGVWALIVLVLAAQAFVLGGRVQDLQPLAIGLGTGIAASAAVIVFQVWSDILPTGLFVNPADLGEAAAIVLVLLCVHHLWWLAAIAAPVLVISGSRAGFLAVGVAGLVALAFRSRRWALVMIVPVVLAVVALALQRPGTVVERLAIWGEMTQGFSWFGSGLGSFATLFPYLTTTIDTLLQYPEHAHNDLLEIAFELGAPGVICVAVCGGWLLTRDVPERVVLAAFAAMALVDFPAHRPIPLLAAMVAAGHVAVRGRTIHRIVTYGREATWDGTELANSAAWPVYSTVAGGALVVPLDSSVSSGARADGGGFNQG